MTKTAVSPLDQKLDCHSRISSQKTPTFSHRIKSVKTPCQGCPKVSRESLLPDNNRRLQQTKCLILASSEWHRDNYRGGPHRNSLEAPFSLRQCDYYVKNPVSYFYHICCPSSCQCIHGEVITSHPRKIGWRPTDGGGVWRRIQSDTLGAVRRQERATRELKYHR